MDDDDIVEMSFEEAAKTDTRLAGALLRNALNDIEIVCVRDGVLLPRAAQEALLMARENLNIAITVVDMAQKQCSCGFRSINAIDFADHLGANDCPRN